MFKDRMEFSFEFQSAPPARGATPSHFQSASMNGFQSAPPARGATRRRT